MYIFKIQSFKIKMSPKIQFLKKIAEITFFWPKIRFMLENAEIAINHVNMIKSC